MPPPTARGGEESPSASPPEVDLSGVLFKRSFLRNEWQRRFFVLQSDADGFRIAYWHEQPKAMDTSSSPPRKQFTLRTSDSPDLAHRWAVMSSSLRPAAFALQMPRQTMLLCAESELERTRWVDGLGKLIKQARTSAGRANGTPPNPATRALRYTPTTDTRSDSPPSDRGEADAGHRPSRRSWPNLPERWSAPAEHGVGRGVSPATSGRQACGSAEMRQQGASKRTTSRLWEEPTRVAVPLSEVDAEEDEEPLSAQTLECAPQPRLYTHLIRKLRPGQDLSKVLIPSCFLERRSLLEKFADAWLHVDLLLEATALLDPLERFLQVLRWYCSGWQNHYPPGLIKKPYNPIIGETFSCFWSVPGAGVTEYFAEQVSHRPPVSAIFVKNATCGVKCGGQVFTRSQFRGNSALSMMEGFFSVELEHADESFHMTLPTFSACGLLYGSMRMEIVGSTVLTCPQSGFSASVEWLSKPSMRGEEHANQLHASVSDADGRGVCEVKGRWDGQLHITDRASGESSLFLDLEGLHCWPKRVLPVEQQGPFESRRLWRHVTRLVNQQAVDWEGVDVEKARLEDSQRELAIHKFPGQGVNWVTKKFHLKECVHPITGKTQPLWVFDDSHVQAPADHLTLLYMARRFAWDGMGEFYGWRDTGADLVSSRASLARLTGGDDVLDERDELDDAQGALTPRQRSHGFPSAPPLRDEACRSGAAGSCSFGSLAIFVCGVLLGLLLRGDTVVQIQLAPRRAETSGHGPAAISGLATWLNSPPT